MTDHSAPGWPGVPVPGSGGTLVIRTWREPDGEHGFRARVTYSEGAGEHGSLSAADREEVLRAVRQWLSAQDG